MFDKKGIPSEEIDTIRRAIISGMGNCLNGLKFVNEKNKETAKNVIDFFSRVISGCVMGTVVCEEHLSANKAIALTTVSLMALCKQYENIQKEMDILLNVLPLDEFVKLNKMDGVFDEKTYENDGDNNE